MSLLRERSESGKVTLRDMIWLNVQGEIEYEAKEKAEIEKELERHKYEVERFKDIYAMLADIRFIATSNLYFETDTDFENFITSLPSQKIYGNKTKPEKPKCTASIRKPGEEPAWKKNTVSPNP